MVAQGQGKSGSGSGSSGGGSSGSSSGSDSGSSGYSNAGINATLDLDCPQFPQSPQFSPTMRNAPHAHATGTNNLKLIKLGKKPRATRQTHSSRTLAA